MPFENQEHAASGEEQHKPLAGRRLLWFLVVPIALCVAAIIVFGARRASKRTLSQETQQNVAIPVSLVHAQPGAAADDLVLPATLQAMDDAPLYARVNGYVRSWSTDIGTRVKRGQVMAVIDSPETDQQLLRAEALLSQAHSNLSLANTTAKRYQELIKDNSVAQQEVDQNNQNVQSQSANVKAASADVSQLRQQQQYETIVAPFDGVVTQRHVSMGDLVNAGNSGTGAELFHVARVSTMRIFVSVPEGYSQQVSKGEGVQVTLAEFPGKTFSGVVARTNHAIDIATRTLLVEVDVANANGELMPGAYAEVHFKLAAPVQRLMVSTGSVLFQAAGPQVAVVDSSNHVHLREVAIGSDLGNRMEVLSAITPQDALVANPPDFLVDGMAVSTELADGKQALP